MVLVQALGLALRVHARTASEKDEWAVGHPGSSVSAIAEVTSTQHNAKQHLDAPLLPPGQAQCGRGCQLGETYATAVHPRPLGLPRACGHSHISCASW